MGAKCGAILISLCSTLNRRDRVSGMIFSFPGFVLNREIIRLKRDGPSCKHIRCILHGIQITKSAVIRNTNENGAPIYRVSNELPLTLLLGILLELPSNAVDLR